MRTSTRWLALAGTAALALTTGLAGLAIGATVAPAPDVPAAVATAALVPGAEPDAGLSDAELAVLAPELERDAAAAPNALRQRLLRLGGRNLVHAEVTVDRKGTLVTFQVDRGTIATVGAGSLTIAHAGGGSETVATTDETRVRKSAKKSALAHLAKGDTVVVLSTVENGKATATFVLVPAQKAAAPSGGSGSSATPAPQPEG